MTADAEEIRRRKAEIRVAAEQNRRAQPGKDALSRRICEAFAAAAEYAAASTVLFYVGVRDEVRTRDLLAEALRSPKRILVPYCTGGQLELFHLQELEELAPAPFGLFEPKWQLRECPRRRVEVSEVDLAMVPGVAFDRRGGRLGHGKGYYDKLLGRARPDARLVALAFECQVFSQIPMLPHDVFMDRVITEEAIYEAMVCSREG